MCEIIEQYFKSPSSLLSEGEVNKIDDLSFLNESAFFLDAIKELKEKATIFSIKSSERSYLFFYFSSTDRAFLTTKDFIDKNQKLHKIHKSFVLSLGEIIDIRNQSLKQMQPLLNVFPSGEDIFGLGALEEDYTHKCKVSGIKERQELKALTTIAFEANGNLIQYSEDGTIYLYLNDHSPDRRDIQKLSDTPEDTFYSGGFDDVLGWSNAFIRSFM